MIPDFDEAMTGITKEMVPDDELRALYQQLERLRREENFTIESLTTDSHKPGGKLIKKISMALCGWMMRAVIEQVRRNRLQQEDLMYYMLEYMKHHTTGDGGEKE